ncbi:MAG TPA: HAD family hydrolase [Anaerovoracaceae bacterium]|nr:HAD family hydrolase [Anaerovoracaceae bacterium]
MKYDTVLFDLDGTLLDTLDDLTDSINAVMQKEGYQLRTKEEIREYIGDGVKMLMERSLPQGTPENEILRCLTMFREIYQKNMLHRTKPYEEIPSMLKRLKEMEMKVGVVSNKPDEATGEMCRMFFNRNVDAAVGDNQERKKKPEPDNVYEVLKQLGSNRDKTLYVGDSNVDVRTAKNAGLDCVGVTWGYRSRETLIEEGADHIIDEPNQLITLIEKANTSKSDILKNTNK